MCSVANDMIADAMKKNFNRLTYPAFLEVYVLCRGSGEGREKLHYSATGH